MCYCGSKGQRGGYGSCVTVGLTDREGVTGHVLLWV